MNICAVSFHCCPFSLLGGDGTGGMNVYLRELCSVAEDFPGTRIDIFTRIQNPKFRGIRHFSPHARVIHLKGGPERPVDRTELYEYLPEFKRNMESFIAQNKEDYDIIYTHYWLSGLVGERVRETFNLPLVHIYHTLAFIKRKVLESENREHSNRLRSEEHLARVSDAIISSSRHEMRNLIDEYGISPSKIKLIYPGVNPTLFFPVVNGKTPRDIQRKKGEKIVLFVGRIDPVKGLMTVIDALSVLRKEETSLYDQLKLFIVGGGRKDKDFPQNQEYIRLAESIRKKKLAEKVIFLGSKKQSQLRRYYSAADALVVPSLYESFGLVAMEALACGTPVIASRIGELESIVREGKNGLSFCPEDPALLADSLKRFFSVKDSFWKKERIRGDVLNNFSWGKTATETYSFLEKVAGKRAPLTTISQRGGIPRQV
ncbi:MAG: glycosyltransferase [Candidatus Aminicenantes bacterium]|nr:glycosyltransferase [Candidatus Aminicenantes bacterium]